MIGYKTLTSWSPDSWRGGPAGEGWWLSHPSTVHSICIIKYHRRWINTEEKAKVVAAVWGDRNYSVP